MFAAMMPVAAEAGVVDGCYSSAEGTYAGISVQVKLGSSTVLSSGDLDAIFDKIAEHHDASNLDLTWNTAGKNAMKAAMDCIFDAEYATLSGIVTNERFSPLRVRDYTATVYNDTPAVTGRMRFDHADAVGCTGGPVVFFEEVSGSRNAAVAFTSFGSHDLEVDIGFTEPGACLPNGQCDGACLGECDPGTGEASCYCSGSGACDKDGFGGSDANDYNIFAWLEE